MEDPSIMKYNTGIKRLERCYELIKLSEILPVQKSLEWLKQRQQCITASDIHTVISCKSLNNQTMRILIQAKAGNKDEETVIDSFANIYTRWGEKYEPTSVQIYEKIYKVKVYEAPLIVNIEAHIGASCDGFIPITEGNNSPDGECIEIKNPYTRIPGVSYKNEEYPPITYQNQMQAQLFITGFNICNYMDCKTEEWTDETEFISDVTYYLKIDSNNVNLSTSIYGIIAQFVDKEDNRNTILSEIVDLENVDPNETYCVTPYYIYSPLIKSDFTDYNKIKSDLEKLVDETLKKKESLRFIRYYYWKLIKYEHMRIKRDPYWYTRVKPKIEQFWEKVVELQKEELQKEE